MQRQKTKLSCSDCGKSDYVKSGFVMNRNGKHQRYLCKSCGHLGIRKNGDF